MPILVMTVREQAVLSSIIDIHRDGLIVSKEAMLDDLEDSPAVRQEMMAAVDDAIVWTERLQRRMDDAF